MKIQLQFYVTLFSKIMNIFILRVELHVTGQM